MAAKKYESIFLIDDDKITNLLNLNVLENHGVNGNIQAFVDPGEALSCLEDSLNKGESLLLLLDLNMPEMNGFELLDKLQYFDTSNLDVIIVTSSIAQDDFEKSMSYKQVKGFITKPLKAIEIEKILDTEIQLS
ncbi:response regulator [Gramella jeungdoensis]|uniref:Response regulator n=1 Tax=Gramella jeungdoensis TaxID=708091 RepID=A0ABT0Z4U1_9FLAO|nr:response regulator [Gramella jeungdoensis]MCM8570430.1 response regulator [Gramella jeungdoensis]